MKRLDEIIRERIDNTEFDTLVPIFDFHILGLGIYVNRYSEFSVECLETSPYTPDGDVPLIFIHFGYIQLSFYSKKLYKYVYDKKYGVDLVLK